MRAEFSSKRSSRMVVGVLAVWLGGLGAAALSAVPAAAKEKEPAGALAAARFSITIDGYEIAAFTSLERLTSRITSAAGAETGPVRVVTPPESKALVVLTRGLDNSQEMWAWHEAARFGVPGARKSATLVAYAADGRPVARYHLTDAWPSKIEIGALKAGASEVLMETVTLTCELIQRIPI